MTHDENGITNGHAAPPTYAMTITFDTGNGSIRVDGVPPSKITAFGMLTMAQAIITSMGNSAPKASPIIGVPPGLRLKT